MAGGAGTRLFPATREVSKQLLPVYDKPMIYYPLSALMLAGLREVLIISTPRDLPRFSGLLAIFDHIDVIPDSRANRVNCIAAVSIGEEFIGSDTVTPAACDNIFYGSAYELIDRRKRPETRGDRFRL